MVHISMKEDSLVGTQYVLLPSDQVFGGISVIGQMSLADGYDWRILWHCVG